MSDSLLLVSLVVKYLLLIKVMLTQIVKNFIPTDDFGRFVCCLRNFEFFLFDTTLYLLLQLLDLLFKPYNVIFTDFFALTVTCVKVANSTQQLLNSVF